MDKQLIEKLKLACNQFYLGKDLDKPQMTDSEFDTLRRQYEEEHGSVKLLVDWELDMQMPNEYIGSLDKFIVNDNDLGKYIKEYVKNNEVGYHYLNYKYDGSSIIAYYKDGRLQKILGTPDVEFGFVRTKAFWNLFPHEVPTDVHFIQGEVLVDADVYGQLARNKANGLTNSKYKDDEVETEAFIRCYMIDYSVNEWSLERQMKTLSELPVITYERNRYVGVDGDGNPIFELRKDKVFAPAMQFTEDEAPKNPIVDTEEVKFQVDGVVMYANTEITGFKFYYTESAVTEVKEIEWIHQVNGSFVPKLVIDTVCLNEKWVNRVASGGVPNLIGKKMGKGAKVRVILANMTIPKVVEVLEQSEDYQYPTCECGYQLSENDIYGSSLKCQESEKVCDYKFKTWYFSIINSLAYDESLDVNQVSFEEYFRTYFHWFIDQLYVDRWSSEGKCRVTEETELSILQEKVLKCIEEQDVTEMLNTLDQNWDYTDLNWYHFEINSRSWLAVMKEVKENWTKINQEYLDSLSA